MWFSCSCRRVTIPYSKKLIQDPLQHHHRTKSTFSASSTKARPMPSSLSLSTTAARNSENQSSHCSHRNYWLPRRIILMRHGESVGNIDETAYSTIPDWKIPLTKLGKEQATQAGKKLNSYVVRIHYFMFTLVHINVQWKHGPKLSM